MLTLKVEAGKRYERRYAFSEMNTETLNQAKRIFNDYYVKGVILNNDFSDNEWMLTNQLKRMSINFCPNEVKYKKYAEKWLECSYKCFVDGVKIYTVFQMGNVALTGIKEFVHKIIHAVENPHTSLTAECHLIEFLKLLPDNEIKDQVIEDLEDRSIFQSQGKEGRRQRILAEFDSYFKFDDALGNYWTKANETEKLFYFPLYFWWTLTAILPLRPTEFLLIPRACLERKNGENILSVRRTNLKGNKKRIFYNINDDYRIMKYLISDKMATELEHYIKATEKMPLSRLNTLFVQQPHYIFLDKGVPNISTYYSYQNLITCLKKFQLEIMGVDKEQNRINLGDTRHLAMISLIVSGGSPVICRELAGHDDINISSHYYSNISRFVECATYEMYRKQKASCVDVLSHRPIGTGKTMEVNGGRCDSENYSAGKISDCVRVVGANGELGDCLYCPHFIDGKSGKYLAFSNIEKNKNTVDEDSRYLIHVLDMVRKGKGYKEDIQSALLKLQHSSSKYSQCLIKNMEVL